MKNLCIFLQNKLHFTSKPTLYKSEYTWSFDNGTNITALIFSDKVAKLYV